MADSIGTENVRPLDSINASLYDDEYMVAYKCTQVDYHFIRLTENGWYNKASNLAGYYVNADYVDSKTWLIKEYYNSLELTVGTYEGKTYYFAVKVGWDTQ